MIEDVCNLLKAHLVTLPYVEKCAGFIKVVTQTEGKKTIKFPVELGADLANCIQNGPYQSLIPDSKYKSILYFDEGNCLITGRSGSSLMFTSTVRLIGWLNAVLLEKADTSLYVANVLRCIPDGNPINFGLFQKFKVKPTQILPSDPGLFSKFTYDEKTTQFLMHPYGSFGIMFQATFEMNMNAICLPDFDWILQPHEAPIIPPPAIIL